MNQVAIWIRILCIFPGIYMYAYRYFLLSVSRLITSLDVGEAARDSWYLQWFLNS